MSDLNDDLLNYELGDDILDQVFYGADEDELLLSDDDLEKDVSKEEKKQLKADAEQWVKLKIQKDVPQKNAFNNNELQQKTVQVQPSSNGSNSPQNKELSDEVSSTACVTSAAEEVTTACGAVEEISNADKDNVKKIIEDEDNHSKLIVNELSIISDEVSSSNYKDIAATSSNNSATVLKKPQEDFTKDVTCGVEFSDPREDFEDEREEARTNIKTKNERDLEPVMDVLPEKTHGVRYMHNKRMPRMQANMRTFCGYNNPRPLLRFPPSHGQFQINNQVYIHTPQNKTLVNTQNASTHLQISSTSTPATHQHESMRQIRHPYAAAGFRPAMPLVPSPYRQMNPNGNIFSHAPHPHEFGPYGSNTFISNSMGVHPNRAMFRAEIPQIMNAGPGLRPSAMRLQRPPIQGMPTHNYGLPPPPPALRHALPQQTQPLAGVQVPQPASHGLNMPNNIVTSNPATLRPNKVLINPNFKGGVEAATNKFIKETQYMANMGSSVPSPTKSDAELLRQQEEFINKNRQYIEKKRQERYSPLSGPRRGSNSHSRSRSHSRERVREKSYSPTNKRSGGGGSGYIDRERDRDRDRDRERFSRANSRDRERLANNSGNNNSNRASNRFKRAGSRERDYYDHRAPNTFTKRRRSLSPNRGNGRRGSDRDRNETEEDEETRAYRQEIEKQKALREKILRDKELKRRRVAEEKLHEEKREDQQTNFPITSSQQQQQSQQKLKPLIVTERKIITLKKRSSTENQQQQQRQQLEKQQQQQISNEASILPEGKRTLTGRDLTSGKMFNNKIENKDKQQLKSAQKNISEVRKLSAPSDDEVELDYDEDDLILEEEEDRLLASPIPSPSTSAIKRSISRSPQQNNRSLVITKQNNKNNNNTINNMNQKNRLVTKQIFNASNRRVVLKSSSSTTTTTTASTMGSSVVGVGGNNNKSQRDYEATTGSHGRNRSGNNSGTHRDHIFDRLDAGNNKHSKQQQQHQRVVIKHS